MADDPKNYTGTCDANPTVHNPNCTNKWFVDPPNPAKPNEYCERADNAIELLNCGEEYLPVLRAAIKNAKKSIYIAIWGFDEELSLNIDDYNKLGEPKHLPEEIDLIKNILEEKAKSGVEVKIMVQFTMAANDGARILPGIEQTLRTIPNSGWNKKNKKNTFGQEEVEPFYAWWKKAENRTLKLEKLQLITRNPENLGNTKKGEIEIGELKKTAQEINFNYPNPPANMKPLNSDESRTLNGITKKIDFIEKGGINAYNVQMQRRADKIYKDKDGKDIDLPTIAFPQHHQKVILIDLNQETVKNIKKYSPNGFIQGFNFWSSYIDIITHPYREGCWDKTSPHSHNQDVGLQLKGSCLLDLYHNFKEGWNMELDKQKSKYPPKTYLPLPDIPNDAIVGNTNDNKLYHAQILRTWPLKEEQQIFLFIKKAISQLNNFIYIEDQYFRMPEFADLLVNRGQEIIKNSNNQKKLCVFIVTATNEEAFGEAASREVMVNRLGREDVNYKEDKPMLLKSTSDSKNSSEIESERDRRNSKIELLNKDKLKKACESMNKKGILVHICKLKSFKTYQINTGTITCYQDIYVHSKLSIYDYAYLLIGSANWNLRSMTFDSELDIAVEAHDGNNDGLAKSFREKLWNAHFSGTDQNGNVVAGIDRWNPNKTENPEKWFEDWTNALSQNWILYMKGEPLMMNLFPYYEDITALRKKFGIEGLKQNTY